MKLEFDSYTFSVAYVYQTPQTYLQVKTREQSRQVELNHIAVSPGNDITVIHFHTFRFHLDLDPNETLDLIKDEILQEALKTTKLIGDTLNMEKVDSDSIKVIN